MHHCSTALVSLMALGACSFGSATIAPDADPPPDPPRYERLDSTAERTSRVTAASTGSLMGDVFVSLSSGDITHDTGAFFLPVGNGFVDDPDGPANGLYDGAGTLLSTGSIGRNGNVVLPDISEGYDYLVTFAFSEALDSGIGVFGIATDIADMPTSGDVTYRGRSQITMRNVMGGSNQVTLADGDSEMVVRFEDEGGSANVRLDNFRIVGVTGLDEAPIDELVVTNMAVFDDRFAGGRVSGRLNGQHVVLIADVDEFERRRSQVGGSFYGFDEETLAPDEVGGVILVTSNGEANFVEGIFVAD